MNKQPHILEPPIQIPIPPTEGSLPLPVSQEKAVAQIKIPTYRALPHTRRGVVCDFFSQKVFNLPKEPMPFYQFDVTENGFDFEFLGAIDNPSPLCDRSEAEAAAQKYIKTQNEAWAQYWGHDPRYKPASEPFLPLFDDFLELQDCYAVYHPNFEGHVLYWQVNYRVMLPSVRIGKKTYHAAVQGEYVRIGIYNDRAARTMNFRHFATEEIGKEPYFFAPKTVVTNTVVPVVNDNVLAKSAKNNAQPNIVTTTEVVDEFRHDALLYRLNGDCYAAFAATPQGEVAASKSGVKGEEVKDLICSFEENGIYVCGVSNGNVYNYLLNADLINKGIVESGIDFNKALKLCYSTPLGQNLFNKYIKGDGLKGKNGNQELENSSVIFIIHQTTDGNSSGTTRTNVLVKEENKTVDGYNIVFNYEKSVKNNHFIHTIDIFNRQNQVSPYNDLKVEQNYADTIYHEFKFHIDFDPMGALGADITHVIAGWGRRDNGMLTTKQGLLDFPNKYTSDRILRLRPLELEVNPKTSCQEETVKSRKFTGHDVTSVFAAKTEEYDKLIANDDLLDKSDLISVELLVLGSSISNFENVKILLKKKYPATFGKLVVENEIDKDKNFNLHCKLAFAYDYFLDSVNKTRLEDNGFTWEKILNQGDLAFLKQLTDRK